MPLIANTDLPTFKRLKDEGRGVLPPDRALEQDIRELHIGLLNMMPDDALGATERQFFRLVGESNQIVQFYMHPFTLPSIPRDDDASAHIQNYYESFEKLQDDGLDALIITGANIKDPNLENAPFWEELQTVINWASEHVTSTICSCLATHALMQFRHGQKRTQRENGKLWGVYRHNVLNRTHPLMIDTNTIFDVPHSRFNDITQDQFEQAGMQVLAAGKNSGVHMAVSEDGFRMICFQGHPEYDTISLLKEYKREIGVYAKGLRDYPPFPNNYFTDEIKEVLNKYQSLIKPGDILPPFPENQIEPLLENTWRDSSKSVIGNWIGNVYQLTHIDRKIPFMDGVDPNNPFGLKS